jgi:hypothetical protein
MWNGGEVPNQMGQTLNKQVNITTIYIYMHIVISEVGPCNTSSANPLQTSRRAKSLNQRDISSIANFHILINIQD